MRILHTSDWHLGRTLHKVDLSGAHAAFFDHLVETCREEAVDVVLVAGDVYDRALPPVESVELLDDALARLHNFDWEGSGLGDFGKPTRYVARQIARWRKQYIAARAETVPAMDQWGDWLVAHVPARESAYRWRDVSDVVGAARDVARALRQQYRQFGTAAAPGSEDHVAVELEFMAYLCARESAAWGAGTSETGRQYRRQQHKFLDDHLGRWLPDFCRQLDRQTGQSFYICLARLCDRWMRIEHGPGYMAGSR